MNLFHNKVLLFLQLFSLLLQTAHSHEGFVPAVRDGNSCLTPLKIWGTCTSLKYCPEVLTLFIKLSQNQATTYTAELQRLCGHRATLDHYPIVCCMKVITENQITTTTTKTITSSSAYVDDSATLSPPVNKTLEGQFSTCVTNDFETGLCKSLEKCPHLFKKLQDDPQDEDFKSTLRQSHEICGSKPNTDVCCPNSVNHPNRTDNSNKNKNNSNSTQTIRQLPSENEGCGLVNQTGNKIVGGEESSIGAWPWMALIGYDPYSMKPFRCGGCLISSRHVVTAAHCIKPDLSFVRLGEYDLSTESETNYIDVDVINHIKHPDYGQNRRSDIAILLLQRNVEFSDLIAPICMPKSMVLRTKSYVNAMPYIAGWGYTSQGGVTSPILKEAQIPILNNDVCRRIFTQRIPSLPAEDFNNATICAGYTLGGVDTCQGDSGGPLMIAELYKGITRYYIIGVVSYGFGCGRVPGIYISTQYYMNWIIEQIETM